MPVPVFGGQTCQVSQVIDVGVGERGEAKAVDVAEGDGGENHLWSCLFVQSRHVWMFQVRDGTLCCLV